MTGAAASTPPRPPLSPEAYAKYVASLSAGRAATRAKRWDAAIGAFDQALVAKPGDLRALAERGYARLLSGDTKAALIDLDAALDGPADPVLRAQIHYNRGLAYEKLDDRTRAVQAFAASVAHNPTEAAKAKLVKLTLAGLDKPACFVDVDAAPRPASVLADWRDAYALVVGSPAPSESEAKAWFHFTPEEPARIIQTDRDVFAVVPRPRGDVMVVKNVTPHLANGFKCPEFGQVTATIEQGFLHLQAVEDLCETVPGIGGAANWTSTSHGTKRTDHVWDLTSAKHVVSLVRTPADALRIEADAVSVTAGQCASSFPRPKP